MACGGIFGNRMRMFITGGNIVNDLYPIKITTVEGNDGLTISINKEEMDELIYAVAEQRFISATNNINVLGGLLEKLYVMDQYCSSDEMFSEAV